MKKNRFFILGILVTLLIIVVTVFGCDNSDNGGNESSSGFLGTTLKLSGQVWIGSWDHDKEIPVEKLYTGADRTVTSELGGSGSIKNGQLSFSIDTPPSNLESIQEIKSNSDFWFNLEKFGFNLNYNPSNAMAAVFDFLIVSGDGGLRKCIVKNNQTSWEGVFFSM